MSKWQEIITLRFTGKRFDGHALDADALQEVCRMLTLIPRTAEALWRAANPDRERLPKGFGESARVRMRGIGDGSAVVPCEIEVPEVAGELADWNKHDVHRTERAALLTYQTFASVVHDEPLPSELPASLIGEISEFGKKLRDNDEIEISVPSKVPVRYTRKVRERLVQRMEAPSIALAHLTGTVLAADVKQRRFKLWQGEGSFVDVPFSAEQEQTVLTALLNHSERQLSVKAEVVMSGDGRVQRVRSIQSLKFAGSEMEYDASVPSIEDVIAGIVKDVPDSEWDKLPDDLSSNLDHYVYGTPKKPSRKRK